MKWFDCDRGIGLISQQGAGPDVQAELSAVRGSDSRLRQGEKVLFDIILDSAGLRADNIHRLKGRKDGAVPAGSAEPSDAIVYGPLAVGGGERSRRGGEPCPGAAGPVRRSGG
ncbi:cold shock domain-containing protein [Streptomyces roseus]|uniref:cold shock domain-containing protein n=1 Tax=Streptomyces roseus TaxID=66430 RepID=UPI00340B75C9